MDMGRCLWTLLVGAMLLGGSAAGRADEPGPTAPHTQGRKKPKKPKAPKATMSCVSDADCAFTAMADGKCCPSLCPPRVVAKKSAEALEKYAAACSKPEGGCPEPECAPPPVVRQPACVSGKCVARAAPTPSRE